MKAISILCTLLFVACSSTKNKSTSIDMDGPEGARAPEWVYAPDSVCGDSQICAAGEGESLEQSDIRAKKALASVFSTQIQSQLDIHKTTFSDDEVNEMKEFVNIQVGETVDGVLKAVEIEKRFERDKLFFSLAVLDKSKARESIRRQIDIIDSELVHLYSLKRKTGIKRMMTLLDERALLADKMIVVGGNAGRSPVTFSQVQNIKFANKGLDKVHVRSKSNVPKTMEKFFQQLLSESGYKVKDDLAVDYVLDLSYSSKEAYLNVEGFKKYVFTFTAIAVNNVKEKIGTLSVTTSQTGRNEQDAYLRAKPKLQEEIENKIDKLNLK